MSYGPLRKVWVARRPPGFAYITFENHDDAARCVKECDGIMILDKPIRCEWSSRETREVCAHLRVPFPRRGGPTDATTAPIVLTPTIATATATDPTPTIATATATTTIATDPTPTTDTAIPTPADLTIAPPLPTTLAIILTTLAIAPTTLVIVLTTLVIAPTTLAITPTTLATPSP